MANEPNLCSAATLVDQYRHYVIVPGRQCMSFGRVSILGPFVCDLQIVSDCTRNEKQLASLYSDLSSDWWNE